MNDRELHEKIDVGLNGTLRPSQILWIIDACRAHFVPEGHSVVPNGDLKAVICAIIQIRDSSVSIDDTALRSLIACAAAQPTTGRE